MIRKKEEHERREGTPRPATEAEFHEALNRGLRG